MADHVAFAYLIADELEAIENPLFLQYIEHDEQRRMVPKIANFVEDVVPLYSLSEFRSHFRLSREQVEDVITTLGPVYMNLQQTKLPLTNSVLACLWTLLLHNCSQAGHHLFFKGPSPPLLKSPPSLQIWPYQGLKHSGPSLCMLFIRVQES
ncbi:uncharacterized protein LOC127987082 [Carassius gibelio]|uniref:uncharacterized protein LOC127987082 n=1 Tax=Carassius gibelio TaxID=101364 RepID=UPI002277CD5D|nr:uncharacterized protein LOC127987082 [Carassius gibelio]